MKSVAKGQPGSFVAFDRRSGPWPSGSAGHRRSRSPRSWR